MGVGGISTGYIHRKTCAGERDDAPGAPMGQAVSQPAQPSLHLDAPPTRHDDPSLRPGGGDAEFEAMEAALLADVHASFEAQEAELLADLLVAVGPPAPPMSTPS